MRARSNKQWLVGLGLSAACAVAPGGDALASVPDLFGFGARGIAMGGTLTATASGHEAVYYNPAALAYAERPAFALGFQHGEFLLDAGGERREIDSAPALTIGIAVPVPLRGVMERRIVLGFGFVLPQTSVLVADIPRPGEPRFVRVEARAQTVSLMGALGVRIFDELAIGAGFLALSELRGAIDVAPNASGRIGSRVKDELIADYALFAGAFYRPASWLAIGLAYRGESDAEFVLPITASLGESFPLPVPVLDISGTAQFDPREVALAASVEVSPDLLLAAAVVFEEWSRYENPIVYTAVPPNYPAQPAPEFSDVFVARLGAELGLKVGGFGLSPRAGLVFEPSPVPRQGGFHDYLDSDRLIASVGAGFRRWGLSLDVAFQWQLQLERTDEKEGGGSITHGGSLLAGAVEIGVKL